MTTTSKMMSASVGVGERLVYQRVGWGRWGRRLDGMGWDGMGWDGMGVGFEFVVTGDRSGWQCGFQ